MPNPYPIQIADKSGVVRLGGELDFTDGANQPGFPAPPLGDVLTSGQSAGGKKITDLANGTNPQDAATVAQVGVRASASYSGSPVTIADNANAALTWTTKIAGAALLDLSTPTAPAVLAAGLYTVSVYVTPNAPMTVAGYCVVSLRFDFGGVGVAVVGESPPAGAANESATPRAAACGAYYLEPGMTLAALLTNRDGAQGLDFVLSALIGKA